MDPVTSSVTRGSTELARHRVALSRGAQFLDYALTDLSTNPDLDWEDTSGPRDRSESTVMMLPSRELVNLLFVVTLLGLFHRARRLRSSSRMMVVEGSCLHTDHVRLRHGTSRCIRKHHRAQRLRLSPRAIRFGGSCVHTDCACCRNRCCR